MTATDELNVIDGHLTHALKLAVARDWFNARSELRAVLRVVDEHCDEEAEKLLRPSERGGHHGG